MTPALTKINEFAGKIPLTGREIVEQKAKGVFKIVDDEPAPVSENARQLLREVARSSR